MSLRAKEEPAVPPRDLKALYGRILTERSVAPGAGVEVLVAAAAALPPDVLDERPNALPPA